jgi:hypothetical protein
MYVMQTVLYDAVALEGCGCSVSVQYRTMTNYAYELYV